MADNTASPPSIPRNEPPRAKISYRCDAIVRMADIGCPNCGKTVTASAPDCDFDGKTPVVINCHCGFQILRAERRSRGLPLSSFPQWAETPFQQLRASRESRS
jgi:hypothetical protein